MQGHGWGVQRNFLHDFVRDYGHSVWVLHLSADLTFASPLLLHERRWVSSLYSTNDRYLWVGDYMCRCNVKYFRSYHALKNAEISSFPASHLRHHNRDGSVCDHFDSFMQFSRNGDKCGDPRRWISTDLPSFNGLRIWIDFPNRTRDNKWYIADDRSPDGHNCRSCGHSLVRD